MAEAGTPEDLKSSLSGRLIQPGDADYDSARKVWNGMIDKHPQYIVRPQNEQDIISAVKFAAANMMPLAVRGGGHNVGGFGTCDKGMVIDLSLMRDISIDPQNRTARVQGGITWGELDKAAQQHGMATTGGLISETGVGGLTLGGGIGWLMRQHGLTVDNLLSVRIVTSDGTVLTANENENPDLFWAVRGGGGNFGVVSEFTFRLHPVGPMIYGGALFVPFEKAEKLLKFYRDWVKDLPDELNTMFVFITAPPAPFIPQHLQGTLMAAVALCYNGDITRGAELAKPLKDFAEPEVDLLGEMPYIALQSMFDESAPSGILSYWKTEYLKDLNDDLINIILANIEKMGMPFSQFHIQHFGGAVGRIDEDATAFSHRDSPFIINIIGMWNDPAETERHINWTRTFANEVRPHTTGAAYVNFLGYDEDERIRNVYGEKKYSRLVEIKTKYDPNNIFCNNQNIKPMASSAPMS